MTQTGLDRFAFAAVLWMCDHFGASNPRFGPGGINRTVVNDQDMIEFRPRAAHHIADVFRFVKPRNDCRDRRAIHCRCYSSVCHVERSETSLAIVSIGTTSEIIGDSSLRSE